MGEEKKCTWNSDQELIDRQQDIMDIISHSFLKILKINLTDDTYQKILVASDELDPQNGYADKLSDWFVKFAESGQIREEDQKVYRLFCNLDHLRKQMQSGSKFLNCRYRRKVKGRFRWVSMEVIPGKEYTDERQVVILYVRDIHEDYLRQLNFAVRTAKNALSISNLNLTENQYVSGCGDYTTLVMAKEGGTADEYIAFLGQSVQDIETNRRFLEMFDRENLLDQFEKGENLITFPCVFMLEGEMRRALKITIEMEKNSYSGNVEAVLYTVDVTKEYLQNHLIPLLYQTNFHAIGVIDLKRGRIAKNRGALRDVSQLIDSDESYEEVRQRVCKEYIAPVDRESYLERTSLENLKQKLSENDYYAFPIYYEENGEKRIKNYHYRYLSRTFELLIATVEDVTALSEKDALTGGLSQKGFIKEVKKLMQDADRQEQYAVLCVDVKGFKAINELFGILEGNDLLKVLYESLEKSFMEPVITARVEADQYLCLLEWKKLDFKKLAAWCEEDYQIKGRLFRISKRCGIYLIRNRKMTVRTMCDRARLALDIAKSEKSLKPYVIFDDTMSEEYIDRSEILGDFDNSLKSGEFCIYLQPIVDPVSGRISSAEALVRWNHPEKGFISPQYFIPLLEGNGYISQLDLYIVKEVEKFQQKREQEGRRILPVSVNLSWMDFYDADMLDWLHEYVQKNKGRKQTIRFEATETSYAAVVENRNPLLKQIRQHGAQFLLDDFGSGFSSFSTLQNYDFDILKLDIGFVRRIEECDKTKSIIDSIIKMVHQMDAKIVAEGAETLQQVEFLKSRGCDYVQGYYFYKPMPMEDFEAILDEQEVQEY